MKSRRARFSYAAFLVCCSAALAQPAAPPAPAAAPYLSPGQVDSVALLAPPPAAGSEAAVADLKAVRAAQRAAHAEGTIKRAEADNQASCARVADVLQLNAGGDAALDFAAHAALEASAATGAAKRYWHRARPYIVSSKVETPGGIARGNPPGSAEARAWEYTSYPSGHSAFGTACAIVLAQMVPEQRAALFARGRAYGLSRVIIGAHFPSDVEGGRLIGTVTAAFLLQNPQFQVDLRAARAGLRQSLGLPAEPPALTP
ncbi:MAG TPA: phosphatase PAP2 family protein [Steroidobacteraceae bacterium]|nr:phosphatase PAP2 family protein [Steroidobacteraceae bacterium]